jgi:hypothetical protein
VTTTYVSPRQLLFQGNGSPDRINSAGRERGEVDISSSLADPIAICKNRPISTSPFSTAARDIRAYRRRLPPHLTCQGVHFFPGKGCAGSVDGKCQAVRFFPDLKIAKALHGAPPVD